MIALAQGVGSISKLQVLSLEWNEIGDEGSIALAQSISAHSGLQKVGLRHNNVREQGAIALAQSFTDMQLQRLDLGFWQPLQNLTGVFLQPQCVLAAKVCSCRHCRIAQQYRTKGGGVSESGKQELVHEANSMRIVEMQGPAGLVMGGVGLSNSKGCGCCLSPSSLSSSNLYWRNCGH